MPTPKTQAGEAQTSPGLLAIRLVNALGKPFGLDPFPRAFPNSSTAALRDRRNVFDKIYRGNHWASVESRSGVGSEADFATAYRSRLRDCLTGLGVKRIFDAPCGDLNWIGPLTSDGAFDYLGGDISKTLVHDVKKRHPNLQVQIFDICEDAFPTADVWHCRDCLFHLPFEDIRNALANFSRSNIPYALITTHRSMLHRNLDVPLGGFRYLDLERPPISLSRAESYLKDFRLGRDFPRYVGLWRRETIAAAIE